MTKNILLVLATILISISFNEFNHYITEDDKENTIVLTSMVDVNNFKQSSNFGRLYSDSLLTNLKRSGWTIIDYRGVNLSTVTKKGEFYLSRKALTQLPKQHNYIVGTYGLYGNKLLINVRILEAGTNKVIAASNNMINDPKIIEMVLKDNCEALGCSKAKEFSMSLKKDDCKNTSRCECQNPDKCLNEGINR